MKKYNIGVDLGGTKVLCAIIDIEAPLKNLNEEKSAPKVLFEVKKKTKKEKGNEKVTAKLFEALDELFKISKIKKEEITASTKATQSTTSFFKNLQIRTLKSNYHPLR